MRRGEAWLGEARLGEARLGEARLSYSPHSHLADDIQGLAWQGQARRG